VAETFFDLAERRYVCRLLRDLDAAVYGDDVKGLCGHYEAKGWRAVRAGPIARAFMDRRRAERVMINRKETEQRLDRLEELMVGMGSELAPWRGKATPRLDGERRELLNRATDAIKGLDDARVAPVRSLKRPGSEKVA
jgi:hypothetical protein